ncbi:MAG: hypothetical protein AAF533_23860 [Acidobacteriota bacterium]
MTDHLMPLLTVLAPTAAIVASIGCGLLLARGSLDLLLRLLMGAVRPR